MLELIEDFIESVFTPEYVSNIKQAFSLFEAFEHQNAYGGMIDAITDESVSTIEGRADHFNVELANQLDYIVKEHLITLNPEATIKDRLILLDALYRVQHLENYTAIESILSSEDEPLEQMCQVLEELTSEDQSVFLRMIHEVEAKTLKLLGEYIEMKTEDHPEIPVPPETVTRLKQLFTAIGQDNIGYTIIEAGMKIGYPFHVYLPYVKDHLVEDDIQRTANNFISVLYMTDIKDGDMINVYREIADKIVHSLDKVGKIESAMLKTLASVEDQRKLESEQTRVSQELPTERTSE